LKKKKVCIPRSFLVLKVCKQGKNLCSPSSIISKLTKYFHTPLFIICGPGSVVGIAMGWTVRGSNHGGGEIFHTCPDRTWAPLSLLYNGYRDFPGGKKQPGSDADPSPPSSAIGHERVKLYLYSPYGPYGLYRASVPVQ
jgi:hypothetical protein